MYNTSKCKLESSYELSEDFLGRFLHRPLTAHHGYVTSALGICPDQSHLVEKGLKPCIVRVSHLDLQLVQWMVPV